MTEKAIEGKYIDLLNYLKRSNDLAVTLSFEKINKILQAGYLPSSAYKHRAWWANSRSHTQSSSWIDAGYMVKAVKLGEDVVFMKIVEAEKCGQIHEDDLSEKEL